MADNKQYTLDDFTTFQENSINDFTESVQEESSPLTSPASDRNTASYSALLNAPTDIVQAAQTFQAVNEEFSLAGYSPTNQEIVNTRRYQEMASYRQSAVDTLLDPNIDAATKAFTVDYVNNPLNPAYTTQGMTITQEATIPNDGETQEANSLRGVFGAGIESALTYQREKQRIYNEHAVAEQESGSTADWVSVAESFAPLADGFKQARTFASMDGDATLTAASILLPGESKASLVRQFNEVPIDKRIEFMEKISSLIQSQGKTILLPSDKDRANLALLQDITDSGSYSISERVADDFFGLLDVVGVGSLLKKASRFGKGIEATAEATEEASDLARSWQRRMTVDDTQPASVASVLKDANPDKLRQFHYMTEKVDTDDIAFAVHGTTKEAAITSNLAPQPVSATGNVQSKTHLPEKYSDFELMPDSDVLDFVSNTSAPHLSIAEKRALRANTVNDFQNVTGMVNRKEMTTVGELDGGLNISAVYGATDSGWSSVQDAVEQAKYALRNYAIDESNINILVRQGEEYVPVPRETFSALLKGNNTQIKGDYLLQINQKYDYNAGDLLESQFEKFGVDSFFNAFNRTGWFSGKHGAGSLTSQVVDPGILFKPELMKGAVLSDMKSDALTEQILKTSQPFVDTIKAIPVERRAAIENKLREANAKGLSLNETVLTAEGFSKQEITAFNSFRKTQDTIWKLTNDDLVKSFKRQGYGRFTMKEAGLDVIAKELPSSRVEANSRVYDPLNDEVRMMSREEINAHYARNGNIVETSSPMRIDGKDVDLVLNPNHATSGYLKALSDGEQVLAYRKGYYSVRYKDPHFIMQKVINPDTGKVVRDAHGNEKWKAVATAANIPDAKAMIERLKASKGGEYEFRNNMKNEDYDKAYTQMHTAGGLSSQRFRGSRLEDSTGTNAEFGAHIDSPAESMARSISSIASRVSYRDWIETSKQRLLATYRDVMPVRDGHPTYPSNVTDIKGTSKTAADARATFEYIRAMENGYFNAVDDGYKAVVNLLADAAGTKGFSKVESKLRDVGTASASAAPKRIVFDQMIALNPLRQIMVQGGQALMVLTRFPAYSGRIVQDSNLLLLNRMNKDLPEKVYKSFGRTKKGFEAMLQGLEESGISKGIKRHELVQGLVNTTVDASVESMKKASRISKVVNAPVTAYAGVTKLGRKIGFDAGEWYVQSASYMAHWDEAVRTGKDVSKKAVRDEIAYQARNFTGNFARSGALALNNNALSVVTQFMQVPLKMFGLFFNKGIPLKARVTMGVSSVVLFGPPFDLGADAYKAIFGDLPENDFTRQFIQDGLITALSNAMISATFGEKSTIDFGGSLSPYDPSGLADLVINAGKSGFLEVIASTPAGSLVAGSNPRITNLLGSIGRAAGFGEAGETTTMERVALVFNDLAKLSSGYSNIQKALLADAYNKSFSAGGTIISDNLPTPDAIAKAFGFQSLQDVHKFAANEIMKDSKEQVKKDVMTNYNYFHRIVSKEGATVADINYAIEMTHQAMAIYKDNPYALEVWNTEMERRIKAGDVSMFNAIRKAQGWMNNDELERTLDKSDLPKDQKDLLRQWFRMDLSGFDGSAEE